MKFRITSALSVHTLCLAILFLANASLCMADDDPARSGQLVKTSRLKYLAPHKPDVAALLAPPPTTGSAEQAADLEEVRSVYHSATRYFAANMDEKVSVFSFTKVVGTFFVETNLPKTAGFFEQVGLEAKTVTNLGKNLWKRPRPYTLDPSLAGGKAEKSFSYPSGHSTESMVLALVLCELLPERREAIIEHARWIGWHRVELGLHYPTDIYAGRVLGQAIVSEMKSSRAFQRDFASVKEEIIAHLASQPQKAAIKTSEVK